MSSHKSRIAKHLIRYCLTLLGTAAAVACKDPAQGPDAARISLSIARTSATVVQGGSQEVTATLTRYGGFTGTVDLVVTGAPFGVTASVSNVQTSGEVTTATVTLLVGTAVGPGVYQLVVRGFGSGVGNVSRQFSLTVAPPPSVVLSLSTRTGTVWQGNTIWFYANLVRFGGFTGDVAVTVTGAPPGVTVTVYNLQAAGSAGPVTSAFVVLNVDPATVPATYSLVVHGAAQGISEVTANFSLTTAVPGFTLTASSPTLSMAQGASSATTTINVVRAGYTGPVTLAVYGDFGEEGDLPPGVTGTFAPGSTSGSSSVLILTVGSAVLPGVYNLYIECQAQGGNVAGWAYTTLTLTVTAP